MPIFFCGNGGSASDSQHLATELVGRFKNNRKPLAAYSLTADATAITCIANDFGYAFTGEELKNISSNLIHGIKIKKQDTTPSYNFGEGGN